MNNHTTADVPASGVYHVRFSGPNGSDHGTVVVDGGRAHGGDTTYYYIVAFETSGDGRIQARVKIGRHPEGKQAESVFGPLVGATLELAGAATSDGFTLEGNIHGTPSARITISGKRSSELDRL